MLLTLSTNLVAKCAGSHLTFFPFGEEIKQNTIFMVEGYRYEEIINGLNKKYPIYLRSGNQKVKLVIFDKQIGEYGLSQVLMKPIEILKTGTEYEIVIENFPVHEPLHKSKTEVFRKWKVKFGMDTDPPKFKEYPKEVNRESAFYGCGPAVFVNFSCKVNENSGYLVKTVLKNLTTGSIKVYYLTSQNDIVEVGHNMCSGAFALKSEENYEVAFSLIDASGNENLTGQKIIRFKAPKAPK